MTTDPKLLTLVQWLSPSYPIGAFAWSHGLETAIAEGWVCDAESLEAWLDDLLDYGAIKSDAILISLAYRAPDIDAANDLNAAARALSASAERLKEAERQGAAFAKITRDVWSLEMPDFQFPVALGYAGQLVKLDDADLVAIFAQGFVSNLVLAGQRLMGLGQTDAQSVLAALNEKCAALSSVALQSEFDDVYSNCFLSDVAAMRHETLQPRLFQS